MIYGRYYQQIVNARIIKQNLNIMLILEQKCIINVKQPATN